MYCNGAVIGSVTNTMSILSGTPIILNYLTSTLSFYKNVDPVRTYTYKGKYEVICYSTT
jgi:hypothetical protein